MNNCVYLIPSPLNDETIETIPPYVLDAVNSCSAFFVENEKTARRFLKKFSAFITPQRTIAIDDYEWFNIDKKEAETAKVFRQKIKEGKNVGIISEAGCPAVADPGQLLVKIAHEMNVDVKPLVGPSSVLLALMASGMNGQRFQFVGYLPVKEHERSAAIKQLESESEKTNCTQIFIETPYRNNQLFDALVRTCKPATTLCIAVDLTAKSESVSTRPVSEWKKMRPDLNKRPAIFILHSPLRRR